jgi:hypothetical protein
MMIKLYSPRSEGETALLKSILGAAAIPYFVHNDFFGSLRVGPQVDLLNMKTIMVPRAFRHQAQALILDYLEATTPTRNYTPLRDKIRVVAEVLLFGWFVPGRMSFRKTFNELNDEA